jgi:hypothetical protein
MEHMTSITSSTTVSRTYERAARGKRFGCLGPKAPPRHGFYRVRGAHVGVDVVLPVHALVRPAGALVERNVPQREEKVVQKEAWAIQKGLICEECREGGGGIGALPL